MTRAGAARYVSDNSRLTLVPLALRTWRYPTAIRRSWTSHRLLREILSCSASAWLVGTAVAWFQPPAKDEVAQLLKEQALRLLS
jgi:hypothetical protein